MVVAVYGSVDEADAKSAWQGNDRGDDGCLSENFNGDDVSTLSATGTPLHPFCFVRLQLFRYVWRIGIA